MPPVWKYCLKKLFGAVGIVLITQYSNKRGAWKLGKTDLGLYISECLLELGLVSEVATNINTFGHYTQVADLVTLRSWLFRNRFRKLYIFDELNVHAPRRRAMTNKNISILQIIPEISKARCVMIGIGQDIIGVDKDLTKDIWTRGLFIKRSRKIVELKSLLLQKPSYKWENFPRTNIKFDPYETAPFMEKPALEKLIKDEDLRNLALWAKGELHYKDLFDHPQKFHRWLKRTSLRLLELSLHSSQS